MISDRWNIVASLDATDSLLEMIWKRCEAYCFMNNYDDILPIARIGPVAAIYGQVSGDNNEDGSIEARSISIILGFTCSRRGGQSQ
jgi:hypothetical protein